MIKKPLRTSQKRKKARWKFSVLHSWKDYFSIGLASSTYISSILSLATLASKASKDNQIVKEVWFVPIIYFLLGIALVSLVLVPILAIKRSWKSSEKYPSGQKINKAREDIIAYEPVIQKLCEVENNRQQALKSAELIIKSLIDEIQIREKNSSNLLPIIVLGLVALIIWVGFPIQLPGNSSLYDMVVKLAAVGTPFIPVFKFIAELGSQSQILKFKKCLLLLEQAQIRANNTDQQVVPITSTKPRRQFGSARGLISMSDDFDAPLSDFKD